MFAIQVEPRLETRSDINRVVQPPKMAIDLGLYYLYLKENKGADQTRGYPQSMF